jgi:DNA-binding NarL/FixJ family response regulator
VNRRPAFGISSGTDDGPKEGCVIRVRVRAESAITQAGLEAILEADERFQVVRRATSSRSITPTLPDGMEADVLLVEGGESALSSSVPAQEPQLPAPPVVVLVDAPARSEVLRLLQAGIRGILLRDAPPHELTAALLAATDGLAVVSPEILETMFPASSGQVDEEESFAAEPLTAREGEVLALLAVGASNKEIAARLHVSEHTAKFHVSTILSKLGAATRAEAVARGYRQGLILI